VAGAITLAAGLVGARQAGFLLAVIVVVLIVAALTA
jgi:hypothetical protein